MKPRVTMITLGVDDLEASLRFYRDGLGSATEGIVGKEFERSFSGRSCGIPSVVNAFKAHVAALYPDRDLIAASAEDEGEGYGRDGPGA